jgi:hypothetical protein
MFKYKSITFSGIKKLYSGFKALKLNAGLRNIGTLLIVCFLLAFLIVPLQSSFVGIQFRKKMLRKEIKHKIIAGLNEDELVKLKFANSEIQKKLKWKHSKEFEFNGEMYDIVKTKKTADSTEYYCWWDSEESSLNRKLIALVCQNLPDLPENKELGFQLSNFYKSIFFQTDCFAKKLKVENPILNKESASFFYENNRIIADFDFIECPPPNIY